MIPCSSGNSPTMAVKRSHLHSSAARSVSATSFPPTAAISPARVRTRRVLSPTEPSFTWKVTAFRASRKEASGHIAPFPQGLFVPCGRCDMNGLGRMEPVALGVISGHRVEDGDRNDILTVQHHQPVYRTHKFSVARAPMHAPGNRQRIEGS